MINSGPLKDTWTLYNALRFFCIKELDFVEARIRKEGPPLIVFKSSPLEGMGPDYAGAEIVAAGDYLYTDLIGVRITWRKH
jgi:hypothetical protein